MTANAIALARRACLHPMISTGSLVIFAMRFDGIRWRWAVR